MKLNKYRITSVLKVETDIFTSTVASPIGHKPIENIAQWYKRKKFPIIKNDSLIEKILICSDFDWIISVFYIVLLLVYLYYPICLYVFACWGSCYQEGEGPH